MDIKWRMKWKLGFDGALWITRITSLLLEPLKNLSHKKYYYHYHYYHYSYYAY